jgi:hypothetical protein
MCVCVYLVVIHPFTALCVAAQTARFQQRAFIFLLAGDGDLSVAFDRSKQFPFKLAVPKSVGSAKVSYWLQAKADVEFDAVTEAELDSTAPASILKPSLLY